MDFQSPVRPPDFYESLLRAWSDEAVLKGVTENEVALCAAQFAGITIAQTGRSGAEHEAMLEVAKRAMSTAYAGKLAVRYRFGHSRAKQSTG